VTTGHADAVELQQLREAIRGVGGSREDGTALSAIDWRPGWEAVVQLGVTALCVPEDHHGDGLAAEAAVAVAGELGAADYRADDDLIADFVAALRSVQ